jgi:hypothetical protein
MKKLLVSLIVLVAALAIAVTAQAEEKKKGPPKGRTQITFEVTPPTTTVYVDSKKCGEAGKLTTMGVAVSAGTHAIKLVHGGDEMEADVNVKAGTSLNFRYVFEDSGPAVPKEDKKKDDESKKDKKGKDKDKDKGKKDKDAKDGKGGEGDGDKKKKKEEVIDLPPDNSDRAGDGEKKEESSKPWKKGGGEEKEEE